MRVGDRQQQGRTGDGRTGTNPREICPACKDFYLKTFFTSEKNEDGKTRWIKKGKVCPNENCTFCKKD